MNNHEHNFEVIKSGNSLIKAWVKGVEFEDQARQQVLNIAGMPFIHKHVAIMADVHMGVGATIGSVIPTKGAIIPAAVGVDIGCFTGDTKVKLADGRDLSFLELIEEHAKGKQNFCFSLREDGSIAIAKIESPRKTRTSNILIEITLDNKEVISCTPDHLFYKRNGEEFRADQLCVNDSLMPIYIDINENIAYEQRSYKNKKIKMKNYLVVYNPSTNLWDLLHRLADDYNIRNHVYDETLPIRHHSNFNKLDNDPSNIERMAWKDHFHVHSSHAGELNRLGISGFKKAWEKSGDIMAKQSSEKMTKLHQDPEFAAALKLRAGKNFEAYRQSEAFYLMTRSAGIRGAKTLVIRNKTDKARKRSSEVATVNMSREMSCDICGDIFIGHICLFTHKKNVHENPLICSDCTLTFNTVYEFKSHIKCAHNKFKCDKCPKSFKAKGSLSRHNKVVHKNHKIISIKINNCKQTDVYCLSVPEFGNFALSSGVFVHNCGMKAVRTSLTANDLPSNLEHVRAEIERVVPHGRTNQGGSGDRGAWANIPTNVGKVWADNLLSGYNNLCSKHPKVFDKVNSVNHLGSLGGGNHFCELCLDESNNVWIMLHSGSRGIGNRIGQHFIELAKRDMEKYFIHLPDADLAYIPEGSENFSNYVEAVSWAQEFALHNRNLMMENAINALRNCPELPAFQTNVEIVNCHHNYISKEHHFGEDVYVTRKGAVKAGLGDMGIIPGSMGAKSFIVCGKGNPESFNSCSHGAGRRMSRGEAKKTFTVEDHIKATEGVECRKDIDVIDETPAAYKSIDAVMAAQSDLVEIKHTLKQFLCVKG